MAFPKKKKNSAPKGFPEKTWNKLSDTWRSGAETKSTEELEKEIINAVRAISDQSYYMKNDQKLSTLQEQVKDLKGGYTDSIASEKAKVDYCIHLLNERGIAPKGGDDKKAD